MSSDRPRILVVGDAVAGTGFARVTASICSRLCDTYDMHQLGINYYGDPHEHDWPIYPALLGGDAFGVGRLKRMIERVRPALVLLVQDLWIMVDYADVLREFRPDLRVVMYIPIDSEPLDPEVVARLDVADLVVAYTEFGARALSSAMHVAARSRPEFHPAPVRIVPHGVDTNHFFALGDAAAIPSQVGRHAARRQLFPGRDDLADAFIVFNGNRNQPRKRIDITGKAFALFAADKPADVMLYLHMGMEDKGWNLTGLARRFGIEGRLIISPTNELDHWVDTDRLNVILNACDIGVNTATGEGWGLVSFEHAATGAAQIVPRHSACEELWEGHAEMVDPVYSLTNEGILTEGWLVSPGSVAQAINHMYADEDYRLAMSVAAFENATQPRYSWDRIAEQWDALLTEALR